MITIKTPREIELLRKAGNIVYKTHQYLQPFIKEGITTDKLNELAHNFILEQDATPSFLGYNGYPKSICVSINEQVVHGISSSYKLRKGDIVSIDIGACYQGYHGDSAWTYIVGKPTSDTKRLMDGTKEALYKGLKAIKPGNHVGDIGLAVEKCAKKYNLSVVRELVGHGVGANLHEEPDVPNFSMKNKGPLLKEGMVIAVEPMLNLGSRHVVIEDDDWTITTYDRKPSAHYEHTVLVTKDGYEILTGE